METTRRRRAGHGKAPRRVIWALLEDLLLVELGLVVGRVALVEVGHRFLWAAAAGGGGVDGVPGPRLAGARRAQSCSELLPAEQPGEASDGAQDCSRRSRALLLVQTINIRARSPLGRSGAALRSLG